MSAFIRTMSIAPLLVPFLAAGIDGSAAKSQGGCFRNNNNYYYRMCYACKDHPGAKENLVFGGIRQRDVTRAQRTDYKNTGNSGGDTSSGEVGSSSPFASSSP